MSELTEDLEKSVRQLSRITMELTSEIMAMGKHLGLLTDKVNALDQAAHRRLSALEVFVHPKEAVPPESSAAPLELVNKKRTKNADEKKA